LSAYTEEQGADSESTVAKLYGEELHKIKVFEAAESGAKKRDLPIADATEKQHFNLNVDFDIAAAPFNIYVDAEDEESVGSGRGPPEMETENVAPECLDLLMGKQSNWMKNVDEIDGVIAASSKLLPMLSHTKPSLVSLQQQNHIACLLVQPRD
jgi:hypothetical protein